MLHRGAAILLPYLGPEHRQAIQTEVGHYILQPRTLTQTAPRADTESASACKTSSPLLPHPRLMIRLGQPPATACITPVEGHTSPAESILSPTPARDCRPNAQELAATPSNAATRNLRLEHAQAALVKKRCHPHRPRDRRYCQTRSQYLPMGIPSSGSHLGLRMLY